jgi:hypothetical protein
MPTEHDIKAVLSENESERVNVVCPKHNYVGNKIPPTPNGCKHCWMAYYVWDLATTPPSKRQERLDELESIIKHAVEFEQKGTFGKDFELYEPTDPRFRVDYEKDGHND